MCGLDRVVMILPQVHLRNGEVAAAWVTLWGHPAWGLRGASLLATRPWTLHASGRSRARHFRRTVLAPDAAFAGDGLDIRRCLRTTPTLTVSERSRA